jgi:hypothetical protein
VDHELSVIPALGTFLLGQRIRIAPPHCDFNPDCYCDPCIKLDPAWRVGFAYVVRKP